MNTKRKQTIRLNESQLHRIIKESVRKVLREEFEEKQEIFTLNAFDLEYEESIDNGYTVVDYYSIDDAIDAARKSAEEESNAEHVIIVSVMAGEYEKNGDVYGEPYAIYTISNKDKRTTQIARKKAGYASLEADEYVG